MECVPACMCLRMRECVKECRSCREVNDFKVDSDQSAFLPIVTLEQGYNADTHTNRFAVVHLRFTKIERSFGSLVVLLATSAHCNIMEPRQGDSSSTSYGDTCRQTNTRICIHARTQADRQTHTHTQHTYTHTYAWGHATSYKERNTAKSGDTKRHELVSNSIPICKIISSFINLKHISDSLATPYSLDNSQTATLFSMERHDN